MLEGMAEPSWPCAQQSHAAGLRRGPERARGPWQCGELILSPAVAMDGERTVHEFTVNIGSGSHLTLAHQPPIPRQLPRDISHFVGRRSQLRELTRVLGP